MTPTTLLVVYAISWWMTLFMLLPIGAAPDPNPQKGNASSAPKKAYMKEKILATTIIAAVITAIFFYLLEHGIVGAGS